MNTYQGMIIIGKLLKIGTSRLVHYCLKCMCFFTQIVCVCPLQRPAREKTPAKAEAEVGFLT